MVCLSIAEYCDRGRANIDFITPILHVYETFAGLMQLSTKSGYNWHKMFVFVICVVYLTRFRILILLVILLICTKSNRN